ncbi:hypothetical protein [Bacteroides pyogenes]|uniref:Uncharacterized protein n=3 Tax=Bacteroides pyogenes TaxID=310300 RepID=W4PGB7_9BACE|nr:hypothetical protein [Bacteroides pyogenes]GAE14848.1 hypothetical protein JCM6292_1042 [Bacteroides pyogenes JCM 6292]MBR8706869.1 hypothetical protein [Bacteroides pyogenes]MCE9107433.1 hypothetical protein [Bacteroides pyogenes]MCF2708827.1 hypothetical protein [Bacteroides pyogenes]MCI7071386.1 hypothetical protein [Bacteroides pyogenes]
MDFFRYDSISKLVVAFMNADRLITYNYLADELHIRKATVSAAKKGGDLHVGQYVRIIRLMAETVQITLLMPVLVRQIRKALAEHRNVVVGTVPANEQGKSEPDDWEVMMKWRDV